MRVPSGAKSKTRWFAQRNKRRRREILRRFFLHLLLRQASHRVHLPPPWTGFGVYFTLLRPFNGL